LISIKLHEREHARRLNRAIDQALLEPGRDDAAKLGELGGRLSPVELAERVRRRAARLGARSRRIPQRGDALIAALYAAAAPPGWFSAWCDGSSSRTPPGRAGVGGVVMDPGGRVVARLARFHAGLDPFAAEIAALAAVLKAGLKAGAMRMRVHTDCVALIRLWHERRSDSRLDSVRALSRGFRALALRAIPRSHNRTAHVLAREAMLRAALPMALPGDWRDTSQSEVGPDSSKGTPR
jgi:ribonuclease HI